MTNTFRYFALIFIALGTVALSCHTYSTQPNDVPGNPLNLHAALVTPNEVQIAWSNPAAANNVYRLVRNGTVLFDSLAVPKNDTSFTYKDSGGAMPISPETQYAYKLYRVLSNDSANVQVRTGDTTKDAYNFTFYRLGETQSVLTGIWTDGPQNIWVCGSIDSQSVQNDYGIAHIVNGNVTLYTSIGVSSIGNPQSVYGLNDTTVWFCQPGGVLMRWNGQKIIQYNFAGGDPTLPTWPYQYWCLYVAPDGEVFSGADSGRILHRKQNGAWELMQTPTSLFIVSILGFSPTNIYATAVYTAIQTTLMHYDGTSWNIVPVDSTVPPGSYSVWGENPDSLYLAGNGLYHEHGTTWDNITPSSEIYALGGIYSEGSDNLFITGQDNFVAKWDGIKWNHYTTPFPPNVNAGLYQIFMLNGVFYGAGGDENGGYYVIGQ